MNNGLVLSPLSKTWIFDIDGTLAKHNGYKIDGKDTILPGVAEFMAGIPDDNLIILVTSRKDEYRQITLDFLKENNIRYDHIIFNAPYGERIIVNDRKPSGLDMSVAINIDRDSFAEGMPEISIDESL